MTGLTYNGKTDSGEPRWDALKNCKLTIYEMTITLQVIVLLILLTLSIYRFEHDPGT